MAYFQRGASAGNCSALAYPDITNLTRAHMEAASAILQTYVSASIGSSKKAFVRIQLDLITFAPQILYHKDLFNRDSREFILSIDYTPAFQQPSDIVLTETSLPVDARLTDLTGTGDDSISITDPSSRNGNPVLLFYRRDIFAAHNITVPLTWEELLEAAAKLNGTDFDGDGTPDHAICFNTSPVCTRAYYLLLGILGPMLQASSPAAGVFLDPDTLEPLVTTAAMHRALAIYANLSRFQDPNGELTCSSSSTLFATGQCAMTFNQDQFQRSRDHSPNVIGNMGTALLPGSPYALNRTTATLQPCTSALCPMATPHPTTGALVNHAPLYTIYRIHFIPSTTVTPAASAGSNSFFNYFFTNLNAGFVEKLLQALGLLPIPPSSPDAPAGSTNTTNSTAPAAAAGNSKATQTQPGAARGGPPGVGPPPLNPQPLVELGYNLQDTTSFLPVFITGYTHPNRVFDIALPGASYYRYAMAEGALNSTVPGANLTQVMATMDAKFRMVMTVFNNTKLLRQQYWSMIGYTPSEKPLNTSQVAEGAGSGGATWRSSYIAAIVVPVSVLLLLVMLCWLQGWRHRQHRNILGAAVAPGVGASTTLLVTDIQDSTVMWESLPMDTMEQVLHVHHSTLRSLQDKYFGYESATEGDSFIIAFHCASDALAYALEAQQKLLDAPWPQQFLDNCPGARLEEAVICNTAEVDLSHTAKRLQLSSKQSKFGFLAASRSDFFSAQRSASSRAHAAPWWQVLAPHRQQAKANGNKHEAGAASSSDNATIFSLGDSDEQDEQVLTTTYFAHADGASSFGWVLSQAWAQQDDELLRLDPEFQRTSQSTEAWQKVRVWRGLRVRMGIHSGLEDPVHVAYNRASHRTQYSGPFAATAKAVSDAGHGGQVLLSGEAFAQLAARAKDVPIMLMGEHVLKEEQPPEPLYQVAIPGLEARLGTLPPLRTVVQMGDGILRAPVGKVTVVFMNAAGVSTLMAWDAEVTQAAVQQYHETANTLATRYSGYVVEMADGLSLVVFQQPQEAIAWALAVQTAMLQAELPKKLLQHELCEPVYATVTIAAEGKNVGAADIMVSQLCSRGLRLKVGVDTGTALDAIHGSTGRMSYRGKVMNRAARIAAAASTGQVLCSEQCWQAAESGPVVLQECIMASPLGRQVALKGVTQNIQLYSCTRAPTSDSGADDAVQRMSACRSLNAAEILAPVAEGAPSEDEGQWQLVPANAAAAAATTPIAEL